MLLAQSIFLTGEDLENQFGLEPVYKSLVKSGTHRNSNITPAEVVYFHKVKDGRQTTYSPTEVLELIEQHLRTTGRIPKSKTVLKRSIESSFFYAEPQVFAELGDYEKDQPLYCHLVMQFVF